MAVRQACAAQAARDGQAGACLRLVGAEVLLQVRDHGVHRVAIEGQEGVVVCHGHDAQLYVLLRQACAAVPVTSRSCLLSFAAFCLA